MSNTRNSHQFPGGAALRFCGLLGLLLAAFSLASGCQGEPEEPALSPEEGRLVDELVELHRLQILRDTNPALAESLRVALQSSLDGATLDERVRSLGDDPARGAVLLRAVRDSLAARRRELFGQSALPDEGPGRARAATNPPPAASQESGDG